MKHYRLWFYFKKSLKKIRKYFCSLKSSVIFETSNKQKDRKMKTFSTAQAKEDIREKFNTVSFRKFGNAFRKHIDNQFKAEFNLKCNGGQVCEDFTWSELASYIIGDGSYSVNESQYKGFMSEF